MSVILTNRTHIFEYTDSVLHDEWMGIAAVFEIAKPVLLN